MLIKGYIEPMDKNQGSNILLMLSEGVKESIPPEKNAPTRFFWGSFFGFGMTFLIGTL